MNTKYKIGQFVYFLHNNLVWRSQITEININWDSNIKYFCDCWKNEDELFIDEKSVFNYLKKNVRKDTTGGSINCS